MIGVDAIRSIAPMEDMRFSWITVGDQPRESMRPDFVEGVREEVSVSTFMSRPVPKPTVIWTKFGELVVKSPDHLIGDDNICDVHWIASRIGYLMDHESGRMQVAADSSILPSGVT